MHEKTTFLLSISSGGMAHVLTGWLQVVFYGLAVIGLFRVVFPGKGKFDRKGFLTFLTDIFRKSPKR